MRPVRRQRILTWAVIALAVLVVILASVLVWFTYLAPGSSSPKATIAAVHWTVVQGTIPNGSGWFGPSEFNYSSNGWPLNVTLGSTVGIPWSFSNFDFSNRTIYSVSVNLPYSLVSTNPRLPVSVPSGEDDALLTVTVGVPASGTVPSVLNITIFAR